MPGCVLRGSPARVIGLELPCKHSGTPAGARERRPQLVQRPVETESVKPRRASHQGCELGRGHRDSRGRGHSRRAQRPHPRRLPRQSAAVRRSCRAQSARQASRSRGAPETRGRCRGRHGADGEHSALPISERPAVRVALHDGGGAACRGGTIERPCVQAVHGDHREVVDRVEVDDAPLTGGTPGQLDERVVDPATTCAFVTTRSGAIDESRSGRAHPARVRDARIRGRRMPRPQPVRDRRAPPAGLSARRPGPADRRAAGAHRPSRPTQPGRARRSTGRRRQVLDRAEHRDEPRRSKGRVFRCPATLELTTRRRKGAGDEGRAAAQERSMTSQRRAAVHAPAQRAADGRRAEARCRPARTRIERDDGHRAPAPATATRRCTIGDSQIGGEPARRPGRRASPRLASRPAPLRRSTSATTGGASDDDSRRSSIAALPPSSDATGGSAYALCLRLGTRDASAVCLRVEVTLRS